MIKEDVKNLNNEEFIILNSWGKELKIPLRYSTKAKKVSVKITPNGAEMVLPIKISFNNKHKDFVLAKEPWIRKKLAIFSDSIIVSQDEIPIWGQYYKIERKSSANIKIHLSENKIEIYSTKNNHKFLLTMFLKEKLRTQIDKIAKNIGTIHKLSYSKIKLSNAKFRWGSCSSKKELSFNWRLIFAPLGILEYLVAHEMAHLAEMNHSTKFWTLVKKIYPDYKNAELWLKRNGFKLYKYLQ